MSEAAEKRKTNRAALTANRSAKRKGHYKMQFARTEVNQKRRMALHLRSHPHDQKAAHTYEFVKKFGPPESLKLTGRGRKRRDRERPQPEEAA